jgi:hypothetical protein
VAIGLFKYFSTDRYKLDKFANGQVLLTPPKYLNDPWEFLVRTEPQTEDQIRLQFEQFENESGSNRSEQEKEELFQQFCETVTSSHFKEGEGPHFQEKLSALVGVVSLTSDPLNRLMWAHYADSHRGFVAEFKYNNETEWEGFRTILTPFGPALKVPYEPRLHRYNPSLPNIAQVYYAKHSAWKDEEEWRVIEMLQKSTPESTNDGKTYFLLGFRPEYLLGVIFGLRICPSVKQRLLQMLERPEFANVKGEIVRIDPDSGELVTVPLQK